MMISYQVLQVDRCKD